MVQAVKVGLDIVRFGIGIVQQGGCQLGGGVRVFGNALGQRQAAADFCGVQGIVQRIVEIALDAGYESASKFSSAFKQRYGVTPSAYRFAARCASKRDTEIKTE